MCRVEKKKFVGWWYKKGFGLYNYCLLVNFLLVDGLRHLSNHTIGSYIFWRSYLRLLCFAKKMSPCNFTGRHFLFYCYERASITDSRPMLREPLISIKRSLIG